jgi:minor extracellular serine protease Vpr
MIAKRLSCMLRLSGLVFLSFVFFQSLLPAAQPEAGKYAVILQDPPVAETLSRTGLMASRSALQAAGLRQAILARQSTLRDSMEAQKIRVTSSMQHLLNAMFVVATPEQVARLKAMPGVANVVPVRRYKPLLNKAINLVNVPAAWNLLGGVGNAGLGTKIAILDTGIDNSHPAFQDSSLPVPANFPICTAANCQFTNNKIIVARSYVSLLVGSDPTQSRPDDTSARDNIGHGTAVASVAAGETSTGPLATITGVAPKAYLGNYKVFGSGEINGYATSETIDLALEDAVTDGMDVAVLSLGGPAFSGPADIGTVCGYQPGTPCDIESVTIQNAIKSGMLVTVAAGNEAQTSPRRRSTAYPPQVLQPMPSRWARSVTHTPSPVYSRLKAAAYPPTCSRLPTAPGIAYGPGRT